MTTFNRNFIKNPVPQGLVSFKINAANAVKINTVKGVSEAISLNITLSNIQTGDQMVLSKYNLFVSKLPYSNFINFLNEYLEKVDENGFDTNTVHKLIGITGKVDYYINKHNFNDLKNWNFDIPSPIAKAQLSQHVQNNQQVNRFPNNPFIKQAQQSKDTMYYSESHHYDDQYNLESNTYDPTQDTDANIPENPSSISDYFGGMEL